MQTHAYSQTVRFCVEVDADGDARAVPLFAKRVVAHPDHDVDWMQHALRRELAGLSAAVHVLADGRGCAVPRVVDSLPTLRAFVMEDVVGRSLDIDVSAARWGRSHAEVVAATDHFHQLGQWLRRFQAAPFPAATGRIATAQLLEANATRWTRLLTVDDSPQLSTLARRHVERMESWAQRAGTTLPAVACHGDFGPWNVLVHGDQCTVIDFSCSGEHSRWFDVANVLTYLDYLALSPTLRRERIGQFRQAFLAGFERSIEADCPSFQLCVGFYDTCRLLDHCRHLSHGWVEGVKERLVRRQWVNRMTRWIDAVMPHETADE